VGTPVIHNLDRRLIPPFDLSALLICAFSRTLPKYFAKVRRIEVAAGVPELSAVIAASTLQSNALC